MDGPQVGAQPADNRRASRTRLTPQPQSSDPHLRTRTVIRLFKIRRQAAAARFDEAVRGTPAPLDAPQHPWAGRRAPLRDADRALMSPTHLWLRKIPPALHPKRLGRHYPRLANQIAENWQDYPATDQLLASLTTDRRGHRRGFPPDIVRELRVLQVIHQWRKYNPGPLPVRPIVQYLLNGTPPHDAPPHDDDLL